LDWFPILSSICDSARRKDCHCAGALHAEGALAGLAWLDARLVAAAIAHDACMVDDPVHALRSRAASMRAGQWDSQCADPKASPGHSAPPQPC